MGGTVIDNRGGIIIDCNGEGQGIPGDPEWYDTNAALQKAWDDMLREQAEVIADAWGITIEEFWTSDQDNGDFAEAQDLGTFFVMDYAEIRRYWRGDAS